jgi:triacylglycerol lipase
MIQWLQENVKKYKGDANRMFIWAHSAGNGPLGTYIGHPELYGPKGVGVKGAVFMSGNPVPDIGPSGGGRGGAPNTQPGPGSTCGVTSGAGGSDGAITGPSGVTPAPPRGEGGRGGPGGGGGGRGGQQLDAATLAARANLPGFKTTPAKIDLARAELDPGVMGNMAASDIALHDELCKLGEAHCPTMLFLKGESHMSEVFSIDTPDKTVSGPILAWIKKTK